MIPKHLKHNIGFGVLATCARMFFFDQPLYPTALQAGALVFAICCAIDFITSE